ncbi:ribulose-phosphate 3-epimerase [Culicoidibacter larvae]|uniref:Ribulose-phosphate 3-epimerase n=1 Tax=Culicoidibacter larvae TaxID=2579976 RepID=A0A5R8Q9X7_9FIRM|nr:ribulose-phosphate 3-epimerase [Culicoidibacter larvae]TLG72733.1 ribulose-phosphate 3-epimerase [Culicoidibacter larvae]
MMYLTPSLMCADWCNIGAVVAELEQSGVDGFHVDIMDGVFVDNFALGMQDIMALKQLTQKPLDIHLMLQNPQKYIAQFAEAGADIIYVHPESSHYIIRTLQQIRTFGVKSGIAINPETTVSEIVDYLEYADLVMVMTVTPGFSGGTYLDFTERKVAQLTKHKAELGLTLEIFVDGALSEERVQRLHDFGASGFVLGTSALFGKSESYLEIITRMKANG